MKNKKPTNLSLSEQALSLSQAIMDHTGENRTGLVERLIREEAIRQGTIFHADFFRRWDEKMKERSNEENPDAV